MGMRRVLSLFCFLLVCDVAFAETIKLKSGRIIDGKVVEHTADAIKVDTGIGVVTTYYLDEIESIDGESNADRTDLGKANDIEKNEVLRTELENTIKEADSLTCKSLMESDAAKLGEGGKEKFRKAVCEGDIQKVSELIEEGVDINTKGKKGVTALVAAIQGKKKEIAQLLIARGADINAKDDYGETALMEAIRIKDIGLTELLISKGADVNVKNERRGLTPLMLAVLEASKSGNLEIVKLLISRGADIKAKDRAGRTLLRYVANHLLEPQEELIELFLSKGLDIDQQNLGGTTVLMSAAGSGNLSLVKYLIAKGANPGLKDKDGMMAIRYAEFGSFSHVVDYLRSLLSGNIPEVEEIEKAGIGGIVISEAEMIHKAKQTITSDLPIAMKLYKLDNGRYPTTSEGLKALLAKPSSTPPVESWNGPYLEREPLDPWGRPYNYKSPGTHNADGYDLSSYGSDGVESSDDITNW